MVELLHGTNEGRIKSPVRWLDLTLPTPAGNLACDEALLDQAETGASRGVLRFWESESCFVVLGYANHFADEVRVEACRACAIPILRRCSGGGTVLQGPGCLNYSLILPIDDRGSTSSISATNRWVMETNARALASLLAAPVTVEGHSDLALRGLKFSGNAQRRKRRWFLFHGTLLLNFNLALMEELLLPPPRQPAYRKGRSHGEFLTQLDLPRDAVKEALREAWDAADALKTVPTDSIERLVQEKYSRDDWNLKW